MKTFKLIGFCMFLLIIRTLITGKISFIFLFWNLFLAWLPYFFIGQFHKAKAKYLKFGLFLLSILFLPNSPYIVTDLFHLQKNLVAPLWLDVIMILSFALAGLLFFLMTVNKISCIVNNYLTNCYKRFFFKALLMCLSAYGIYLGRYLRFNSWDILTKPLDLFHDIIRSLFNSNHVKETLAVTLTFAAFLYVLYELYETNSFSNSHAKLREEKSRFI